MSLCFVGVRFPQHCLVSHNIFLCEFNHYIHIKHNGGILGKKLRIMYLSTFNLVETKILIFISPDRRNLNRGSCCTPNFDLRYHLPSASLHCKCFDLSLSIFKADLKFITFSSQELFIFETLNLLIDQC